MAVISIEYCGGNYHDDDDNLIEEPIDYKRVSLFFSDDKEFFFDSGDFIKDWYFAKKKFLEFVDNEYTLVQSSSVDHFIMDGAPYESAYLVFNDNDESKVHLEYEYNEKGWEMFVNKGTKPTWEELKKYCKGE